MRMLFISLDDFLFIINCLFKYLLMYFTAIYLILIIKETHNDISFKEGILYVCIGLLIKGVIIIINCLYFTNMYKIKKFNQKYFKKLFSLHKHEIKNELTDDGSKKNERFQYNSKNTYNTSSIKNLTKKTLNVEEFEYKKLIKKYFFTKIFYSIKKRHKNLELYILKIFTSDFNYYISNIKDFFNVILWFISLSYWRRDTEDMMWNFNESPKYVFRLLIILLSISYLDFIILIFIYNKFKDLFFKLSFLIEIFFSPPFAFYFSTSFFTFEHVIHFYFMMGFLRNLKIFLNLSYMKIKHNSIFTSIELKVLRIILGIILLCHAFASTIYTVQAIYPNNLDGGFIYFLNSYVEYFYFAIISISTVGYGDIFPRNRLSKIICLFFIFWTFIWVPIQLNDLIVAVFSTKTSYGKISMKGDKFILLIGDIDPYILNVFIFESFAYKSKLKFHVLTTYPIQCYEEQIKLADYFCISLYIKHSDLNEKENINLLTNVYAKYAHHLFLFSNKLNHDHYDIDTKSFTRLLILKKFLFNKQNVLVELRNNCMSDMIKSMGYKSFITINIKHSLILKNIQYPGIITLILNLFTSYDYDYNINSFKMSKNYENSPLKYYYEFTKGSGAKIFSFNVHKNMIGLNFDKLFHRLYESLGIILLGIETEYKLDYKKTKKKTNKTIKSYILKNKKKKCKFKFLDLCVLKEYEKIDGKELYFNEDNFSDNDLSNNFQIKVKKNKYNLMNTKEIDVTDEKSMYYNNKNNKRNIFLKNIFDEHNKNSKKNNEFFKNKNSFQYLTNYENNINRNNKKKTNEINIEDNSIKDNKHNKKYEQLKCYLNLLGQNYFIQENDKCIVMANSKKVINYLSKANDLFWLFQIKKKNELSFDLKSIIKTKSFKLTKKKNIQSMYSSDLNETNETDQLKTIKIEKETNLKKKYAEKKKEKEKETNDKIISLKYNELFNYTDLKIKKTLKFSNQISYNIKEDNSLFKKLKSNLKKIKFVRNIINIENTIEKDNIRKKKIYVSFNACNSKVFIKSDDELKKKNSKNIIKQKSMKLNKPYKHSILRKHKKNNFKRSIKSNIYNYNIKNLIVYSYKEAYEKYFYKNNNKLLFIVNCTLNVIYLIQMLNYKYNVVILNDDTPTINFFDIHKTNTVFIKCKCIDDYNLINAGLLNAYYILIFPNKLESIDKINEIDMNTIILTRKVVELLKRKKKTNYINNIITELLNPANAIFLDDIKIDKLKVKNSPYHNLFPYVNSMYFRSSNIICESMLYNFMTHHYSFSKFSTCHDTLKSLIKKIHVIYYYDLILYDSSFNDIKNFKDLFTLLSKKNIIPLGLYRKGDKYTPYYIYTKPDELSELRFDDLIYIL